MSLAYDLSGTGDAPVIVLPCSLGTTRALWDGQVEELSRVFRVLRYEHRGHGASTVTPGPYSIRQLAEDALALLDELQLDRVAWCGLSLGGMVGMWIGAHAPARLTSLVLACTSARVGSPDVYADRAAAVRAHGIEPIADGIVERWFTPHAPAELRARFRALLVSAPVEGYAATCEAIADWDFRADLPQVGVRTLVLAGELDTSMPSADSALLAARIPGARHVTLRGAGHLANLEQPAAFSAAALDHLLEVA
jgi:3-oxoadipate enol-lactonase